MVFVIPLTSFFQSSQNIMRLTFEVFSECYMFLKISKNTNAKNFFGSRINVSECNEINATIILYGQIGLNSIAFIHAFLESFSFNFESDK